MRFATRSLAVATLVLASLSPAFASSHYETTYHDTIRPNGQPRSDRVYNAALDHCYSATGQSRTEKDTPAFKACMKGRGYTFLSSKLVQDPHSVAPRKSSPHSTTQQDGGYIDPDTGMVCHDTGIVAVCVPPNGTVHYTNDEGLNCTRTGLMSLCTNF